MSLIDPDKLFDKKLTVYGDTELETDLAIWKKKLQRNIKQEMEMSKDVQRNWREEDRNTAKPTNPWSNPYEDSGTAIPKRGGFRKICDYVDTQCRHPEHNPPTGICLPPGLYVYTCPSCGEEKPIRVPLITM